MSAASCSSSNAHVDELVCTCSVPSRAMRAGHAFRAICSPTAAGPRLRDASDLGLRAEARQLAAHRVYRAGSRLHLHELRGLDGKRRALRRGDDRLAHVGDERSEHAPAPRIELREDVVEQQERRRVPRARRAPSPRRAAAREPSGAALPASRSRAGRDRAGEQPHVVQVRADARRRALDVPFEPRLELGGGRRLAVVGERRSGQAELVRDARAKPGASAASASRRAATSSAPRVTACSVHGATASRDERPAATRRSAALRCAIAAA